MVIKAYGAPDANQHGSVGDIYIDLNSGLTYECVAVKTETTEYNGYVSVTSVPIESPYVWEPMSAIEWVDEVPADFGYLNANPGSIDNFNLNKLVKSIRIPYGVTAIAAGSFNASSWSNVKHMYIPDTVQAIESGCLNGTSIEELTIPGSVLSFGGMWAPYTLTKLTLESGITTLPAGFLHGTNELKTLILPDTLTRIEDGMAASGGVKVTSITLPESLEYIGSGAFSGFGIKEVTIPGSVRENGAGAFASCNALTKITIEDGVPALNQIAPSCPALIEINIPNSVTSMHENEFAGDTALATINIDAAEGSIAGAPWGAPDTCTINWLR